MPWKGTHSQVQRFGRGHLWEATPQSATALSFPPGWHGLLSSAFVGCAIIPGDPRAEEGTMSPFSQRVSPEGPSLVLLRDEELSFDHSEPGLLEGRERLRS